MPGFELDIPEVKDLDIQDEDVAKTVDEIPDEELTKSIKVTLGKYRDEDLIWISIEFLRFKEDIKHGLKKNHTKLNDLKHFSSFDEIKNNLINLIKNLKSKENIENFLEKINNKNNTFSKILTDIKKNQRLCMFVFNYVETDKKGSFNFKYEKQIYLYLAHWYFTNDLNTYRKDRKLENAIEYFNNEILIKEKNCSKKFQDETFLSWAYLYLKRVDCFFKYINYIPTNKNHYQLLITTYLDYLCFYDYILHENTINKLNKAWSQKKFRDRDKVRKPHHLPLTKKAKAELEELSAFKKLSESEMLEQLIHQMFLKEMCDEKENSKY